MINFFGGRYDINNIHWRSMVLNIVSDKDQNISSQSQHQIVDILSCCPLPHSSPESKSLSGVQRAPRLPARQRWLSSSACHALHHDPQVAVGYWATIFDSGARLSVKMTRVFLMHTSTWEQTSYWSFFLHKCMYFLGSISFHMKARKFFHGFTSDVHSVIYVVFVSYILCNSRK